jgi:hypothetical protein
MSTKVPLGLPMAPAAVPGVRSLAPTGVHGPTHLLQQCQLSEELVGVVLSQEVGPLLAGFGIGAVEVFKEAGLGQG